MGRMYRPGQKMNLYWILTFSVTPSIFASHLKMDLQMWAAVLGDFLFTSRGTAGKQGVKSSQG